MPRTGTLSLVEAGNTLASVNVATTTPSSSGYYALTVAAGLPAGTNNLTVVYSGDTNYATSVRLLCDNVDGQASNDSLGLSSSRRQPLAGQPYHDNAEIQAGPLISSTPVPVHYRSPRVAPRRWPRSAWLRARPTAQAFTL